VEKYVTARELHWKRNGDDYSVRIETVNGQGTLSISGRTISFQILESSAHGMRVLIEGANYEIYMWREGRVCTVWCNGTTYRLEQLEGGRAPHATMNVDAGDVRAPMAGKVLRVEVQVDETVAEHQTLVILESMKMETPVRAARNGRVSRILVQPDDVVDMGDLLAVIE
jgi:acetyl/propionyl-CoA carboxylase alpha subunit